MSYPHLQSSSQIGCVWAGVVLTRVRANQPCLVLGLRVKCCKACYPPVTGVSALRRGWCYHCLREGYEIPLSPVAWYNRIFSSERKCKFWFRLCQSKEDKTNREMMANLVNEILSLCELIQSFFWVTPAKGLVHGHLLGTSEQWSFLSRNTGHLGRDISSSSVKIWPSLLQHHLL